MRTVMGLPLSGMLAELTRLRDFFARDVFLDVLDLGDERLPEFLERLGPVFFAARHRVELVFERGGEAVLDVLVEMLGQEAADDLADVRRDEPAVVHVDVFAILERRDDGGVGRGAADAVLFERLHERGFGEARRRLGEVLVAVHIEKSDHVAFFHGGQEAIVFVFRFAVVDVFLVHGHVAGFHQRRAVGAQHVAAGAIRRASACLLGSMSTATVSNNACDICEATARFQMSAYSLY